MVIAAYNSCDANLAPQIEEKKNYGGKP